MSTTLNRQRTWLQNVREGIALIKLMLFGGTNSSEELYNLLSTHNSLAEDSNYINMGYWEDCETFDQACQALANELALIARLDANSVVLDCGNGHGDQDAFFLERYEPKSITGLNITRSHVEIARQRFIDSRLSFIHGSATDMPFDNESFNRVCALESAFHFDTRDDFFNESFRVLKPGGYLATADLIRSTNKMTWEMRIGERMGRAFWQIPKANLYDSDDYKRKLEAAGFVDIELRDISSNVFRGFKNFAQSRANDPEIIMRVHPWIRSAWAKENENQHNFVYILCCARKPE